MVQADTSAEITNSDRPPDSRRILIASLVGTTVEFYDFYIFATAASLVFGPLFFAPTSPSSQLIWSYAIAGAAFFMRPIGGALFGHFGDRRGRKATLVASLLLMGISTALIAALPTYETAGWWAPLLLCLLRIGQGLGLGGEWSGAALLAVENAPPGQHGRFGMVPQLGAPIGFILANGFFLLLGALLSPQDFQAWGWRIPFASSFVLIGLGLWVRLNLTETAAFSRALAKAPPPRVPLSVVFREHLGSTLAGVLAVIVCFVVYYLATAFTLGYGTTQLGYPKQDFLKVQLVAILFMAASILLAGWLSDRTNPRHVLMLGCAFTVIAGFLLAPLMGSGSLVQVFLFLATALTAMGFVYGPLGAWLPSLFPPHVRYTATSLAFNLGGTIGGALTPAVAAATAAKGGLAPVGAYLIGAAVLSLIGLIWAGRSSRVDSLAVTTEVI